MHPARRFLSVVLIPCLLAVSAGRLAAQQPPPAEGDEPQLIAVLRSDATLFDKAKACQRLAVIGTKEAVPVLAELLGNEELSHYARYGLEPIPDRSVDEALRDALGKLEGGLLVGVINSIGMRRDAQAVDDLKKLLGSADAEVAAAAAGALGRIHTPDAVQALRGALADSASLRPAVADACLTAADMLLSEGKQVEAVALCDVLREADLPKHLQIAAVGGAIRARGSAGLPLLVECLHSEDKALFRVALGVAQELPDGEVTRTLIEELPKLEPPPGKAPKELAVVKAEYGAEDKWVDVRQALVIYVLGARGDKAALPVVLEAAKSGRPDIRLAAVRMLAGLGDVSAVPVLLKTAVEAEGELAQAARDSLAELPGREVDSAVAAMLDESKGEQLLTVIDLVGRRGIASAVPALEELADSASAEVSTAAIGALGSTVSLGELSALIDRLVRPKSPEVASAAKEALGRACLRMPDREVCAGKLIERIGEAPTGAKVDLLDLLGVVGGKKALEVVSATAKEGSEELQDAATRVLGEWMSPDAAGVLLELAKTGNHKFRIRALRGYLRIARQLDVPTQGRIAMCGEALSVAQRDDEKKLALEALGRYPSAKSLSLVAAYLDDESLKEVASAAAVEIAQKILDAHPVAVAEAMKKAAEATSDAEVAGRAKRLLRRARAKLR